MCNTNTISSIFIGTAKCYLQLYYVKKKICFQYYSIPLNCVIQNKSKSGRNSCKKTEQMATKNIVLVVTVYLLLSANQKVYWVVNFFLLPFLYCVGILKFSFLSKQWENLCYAYCVIYIIHSHFTFQFHYFKFNTYFPHIFTSPHFLLPLSTCSMAVYYSQICLRRINPKTE